MSTVTDVRKVQHVAIEQRAERMVGSLRPMFDAMPKDSSGRRGFDVVQYVLHRLFVQLHGWIVNGLDTASDARYSSSSIGIFRQHAEDDVHGPLRRVERVVTSTCITLLTLWRPLVCSCITCQ